MVFLGMLRKRIGTTEGVRTPTHTTTSFLNHLIPSVMQFGHLFLSL